MTTMKKKSRSLLTSIAGILISVSVFSVSLSTVTARAQTPPQPASTPRPIQHPPLAIKVYNYTNRPVGDMEISDNYKSKPAGVYSIEPGEAFGPVCCVALKGDRVLVTWRRFASYFDPNPKESWPRTATATIPPYDRKTVKQIAIHIFPDEHVEVEMATKKNFMGDDDKLHITPIVNQLWAKNKDAYDNLGKDDDERGSMLGYKVTEYVGEAWTKYRMTDYDDLLFYCFWKLRGLNFEIHPKVQTLMKNSPNAPGKFAQFMRHLPKGFGEELDSIEAKQQKK